MNKKTKKLVLKKETLTKLSPAELEKVRGASYFIQFHALGATPSLPPCTSRLCSGQ
jgi:hypothetical protein